MPFKRTIYQTVTKYQVTGSLLDKKKSKMAKLVHALDDARFVLSRKMIGQNKRCGVTKVHMQFVKFSERTVSAYIILWPLCFEETNSSHFVTSVLTTLFRELTEEKIYDILHSLQELKCNIWRNIASILRQAMSCVKKYCHQV